MKKSNLLFTLIAVLTLSVSCNNHNESTSNSDSDTILNSNSQIESNTESNSQDSSNISNSDSNSDSSSEETLPDAISVASALEITKKLANGATSSEKYYVIGTINDLYNTTYGNCHLIDGDSDLIIYGSYNFDGSKRFDAMENQFSEGDEVIFYGKLMNYYDSKNNTNKYEMVDAWTIAINGVIQNEETESGGGEIDPSGEFKIIEEMWTTPIKGDSYENYYSIDLNDTGESLKNNLRKDIMHTNNGYGDLARGYKLTDVDMTNSSKVVLYYSGESRTWDFSTYLGSYNINREHVWPQSRYKGISGAVPYADIYNVRPSDADENSSRGNSAFDNNSDIASDQFKGDVARVLFYVATRYEGLKLVDSTSLNNVSMGKLSVLLEWNLKYPVSDLEKQRNKGGQAFQGNRNPFVDNPSFACAIWGTTNSTTRNICSKYTK